MTAEIEAVVEAILDATCNREARERAHPSGVVESAWKELAAAGFPWVGLPERNGGSGGSVVDLMAIIAAIGRRAAPVPLVETALANWLRVSAGLDVAAGSSTVSILPPNAILILADGQLRVDGEFTRIPWAGYVDELVAVFRVDEELYVAAVPLSECTVTPGANLAGESRDTVVAAEVLVPASAVGVVAPETADAALARGALSRAAQMAGALQGVRELTVSHASNRKQFGRPLSAFQLIQTRLALIEEGAVSTRAAVDVAANALEDGTPGPSAAAAKIVAGLAAADVAAHSQQIHGAMGLTMEYDLQHYVRRLASWRWEFGSARSWSRAIGTSARTADDSSLWDTITHSLTWPERGTTPTAQPTGKS